MLSRMNRSVNQHTFLFKLTLWTVPMVLLLGIGTLLLGEEFWEIFAFWFFLFGIIPKVPGMLFTFPFAVHAHRSLTELPDGRITVNQGELWQSLRGWLIAWLQHQALVCTCGIFLPESVYGRSHRLRQQRSRKTLRFDRRVQRKEFLIAASVFQPDIKKGKRSRPASGRLIRNTESS